MQGAMVLAQRSFVNELGREGPCAPVGLDFTVESPLHEAGWWAPEILDALKNPGGGSVAGPR